MREEENNKPSHKRGSRKKVIQLFPKRKASAVYLTGAAIILAGVMIFQLATGGSDNTQSGKGILEQNLSGNSEESVPVGSITEEIKMPVLEENEVSVVKHFYDENASDTEQQDALIYYENQYTKNTGTDFAKADGSAFEVAAALSGTVSNVEEDSLLGNVVELQHDNGLVTVYQSLDDVQVEVGSTVAQGEVIGKAGQSVIGKDLGLHVHFEIRNDGVAVNPETSFDKTIATLQDDLSKAAEEEAASSEAEKDTTTDEQSTSEESNDATPDETDASSGENADSTQG